MFDELNRSDVATREAAMTATTSAKMRLRAGLITLGALTISTVGVVQAQASYGLYDDTIYRSYGTCGARGLYLRTVGLIDDWICAINTTRNVSPPRTGIMLEICRDNDPNPAFACGGGSWKRIQ